MKATIAEGWETVAGLQVARRPYNPVYQLEAIAGARVGVSWLEKGEAILKDAE